MRRSLILLVVLGLTMMAACGGGGSSDNGGGDPVLPVVVINEIYYDSPGSDLSLFVEVKGEVGLDLSSLTLVGVTGSDGMEYDPVALNGTIPADGYFVVADTTTDTGADQVVPGINWQNGPDNVQLVFHYGQSDEQVVDALGYGLFGPGEFFFGEAAPAPDVVPGSSLSRCPDGSDTDDNSADFVETTPSPGAANICN